MIDKSYVLISPVRNEEGTIEITIQSVLAQRILPREWVIVSDGSTDRTDDIVRRYASEHRFIEILPVGKRDERNFASVVFALRAGYLALKCQSYNYLGLLDGDVRLPSDYYEQIMLRLDGDPRLGMAGGVALDVGTKYQRPRNLVDVPGAVQFFTRECFQSLGDLIPVPEGGWDAVTCAQARMRGYQTRLFPELIVDHLKPRNVFLGNDLRRRWQMGMRDYALGYHPIFELFKCLSRFTRERPWGVGAGAWYMGYLASAFSGKPCLLPPDLKRFIRREQMFRLLAGLRPHLDVAPPLPSRGEHARSAR